MITEGDIKELFGRQLDSIHDKKVRRMVVKTWLLGCGRGGWENVEDLKKIPFTLLTETRGVNFIEHTLAVTDGAIGLAKAQIDNYAVMPYEIDMDRLIAGGLLHDVGKLLEIGTDGKGGYRKTKAGDCIRHPISGTVLAAEAGFSDDYLNTIACHAKEGEGRPQVVETILIHQADFATFNPMVYKNKDSLIE